MDMDNTIKFCWQIAKDPNLLSHISCSFLFSCFLEPEVTEDLFPELALWSSPKDPISFVPFVPIQSWPLPNGINLLNSYNLSSSMCLDCNIQLHISLQIVFSPTCFFY